MSHMTANYHTHTWRCNHASGAETEYVENALSAGLKILGFSDHSPYIFPGEYYSNFRMRMDQLDDYVDTILELREVYRGRIEIPLGLEIEFYPGLFPKLLPILRDHPIDYFILGQHFLGDEYDSRYNGVCTRDNGVLRKYCDQTIDAMQTGLFTYFAHPDLIHYLADASEYRRQMRRICVEAKRCQIPLEFNLLGLANGKNYPNMAFWELVAEEGCDVVLGRDAHTPQALLDTETEQLAHQALERFGITPLDRVALRKIK